MQKGAALISTLIIASLLSFLATGFAFIMISDSKIAKDQELAVQTHYLAEAGTQYAVWKLNNDWQKDFESGDLNEETKLTNAFYQGDEIKITAKATSKGLAQIESKASYKGAQRKVMVEVFKALGGITEPLETRAIFAEKKIFFQTSKLNTTGSAHTNSNLELISSAVLVEDTASASQAIIKQGSILDAKQEEGAPLITMPGLDFEDYKQKANLIYTEGQFKVLLQENPVLQGIVYVAGESCEINIEPGQTLTINGFLLTDCTIYIKRESNLIIKNYLNQPSGLASKKSVIINSLAFVNTVGLFYSLHDIMITGANNFSLLGGIINHGELWVLNQLITKINIIYDENIIKTALGQAQDSPLIILEHWEEEY